MSVQGGYTDFTSILAHKWVQRPTFRPVHVKSIFEPLGQSVVTQNYNAGKADFWEVVITSIPLEYREAQKLQAGLNKVGLLGQVAVQDPLFLAPGTDGERPAQANPVVNGASQTGTTIICDGAGSSVLVIAKGQWFNMGAAYFQATADASSDGPGNVTIDFWPTMRISPGDGSTVDINTPFLHALILNIPEVDIQRGTLTPPISLGFQENI